MASKDKTLFYNNSKVTESLKPLFLLQLIFGYDYGLYRNKSEFIKLLIKITSTLTVFILPAVVLYLEIVSNDFDDLFIFPVQYFIEALTTIYIFGPRILNNLNRYDDIDNKLKIKDKYYTIYKWKNIIYLLGLLFLTLAYMGSLGTKSDKGLKASSLFLFFLDISFILRLNLLALVLYRIRKLRKYIEKYYISKSVVTEITEVTEKKNKKDEDEVDPVLFLPLYKCIADQLEDINKCIGFTFTMSFIISALKFIQLICDINEALTPIFQVDIYFVFMSFSLAVHTLVFLGSPGLFGEMIIVEANKIKLSLANRLLRKPKEDEERAIRVFLDYIHVRPLLLVIWGAFSLNLALFNSVISFAITAFIFIMQFNGRQPL